VSQLQEAFNYYHVHIYLIDPTQNDLVMQEGTGEVGRKLKAKGHRLQIGQGIVGLVAKTGEAFLAPDVSKIPYFHPNPLLPRTRAELAVPVHKGNRMLGVLDMQSEEVAGFSQADLTLMQSIADQVAVALENARLFEASQAAIAEVESLNARLTRQLWESSIQKVEHTGYVYTGKTTDPASSIG
jgi:GAF domain-containing protein